MTDPVAIALITAVCTAIPTTLAVWLSSHAQVKKLEEVKLVQQQGALAVADKLDEQNRTAEENNELVSSSAKEAALAAGKAAVTTETIHALVNERLSKEIKDKEAVMASNAQLMAMNAQLMSVLAKTGVKINGGTVVDPGKPKT